MGSNKGTGGGLPKGEWMAKGRSAPMDAEPAAGWWPRPRVRWATRRSARPRRRGTGQLTWDMFLHAGRQGSYGTQGAAARRIGGVGRAVDQASRTAQCGDPPATCPRGGSTCAAPKRYGRDRSPRNGRRGTVRGRRLGSTAKEKGEGEDGVWEGGGESKGGCLSTGRKVCPKRGHGSPRRGKGGTRAVPPGVKKRPHPQGGM